MAFLLLALISFAFSPMRLSSSLSIPSIVTFSKTIHELEAIPKPIEFMHIAYPYIDDRFIDSTINYIASFNPRLVIIHSSIPPGTTRLIQSKVNSKVAYSPVRGKHPNLYEHLRSVSYTHLTLPTTGRV